MTFWMRLELEISFGPVFLCDLAKSPAGTLGVMMGLSLAHCRSQGPCCSGHDIPCCCPAAQRSHQIIHNFLGESWLGFSLLYRAFTYSNGVKHVLSQQRDKTIKPHLVREVSIFLTDSSRSLSVN